MSSKGIAIRTILLLLIGILVVSILTYLVYSYSTGSTLSEYECRGKMVSWCTGCSNAGWSSTVTGGSPLCANDYWTISHDNCDAFDDCSRFIPSVSGGPTTPPGDCSSLCGECGCMTAFQCGFSHPGWGCTEGYSECDPDLIPPECCCHP